MCKYLLWVYRLTLPLEHQHSMLNDSCCVCQFKVEWNRYQAPRVSKKTRVVRYFTPCQNCPGVCIINFAFKLFCVTLSSLYLYAQHRHVNHTVDSHGYIGAGRQWHHGARHGQFSTIMCDGGFNQMVSPALEIGGRWMLKRWLASNDTWGERIPHSLSWKLTSWSGLLGKGGWGQERARDVLLLT